MKPTETMKSDAMEREDGLPYLDEAEIRWAAVAPVLREAAGPWPALCVDLETLGTSPDAVILEIGAVFFDPATGETGPEFSAEVAMRAADQQHRKVDAETLAWWSRRIMQGHAMPGLHGGSDLAEALGGFCRWVARRSKAGDLELWAWGMDFDFPLLKNAAEELELELPWRYTQQRDARTLCKVAGVARQGECGHRGLQDALVEAGAVMAALGVVESRSLREADGAPDFERGWNEYRRQLIETVGRTRLPEWAALSLEIQECYAAGMWAVMEEVPGDQ